MKLAIQKNNLMTLPPFFKTDPLLYNKFENMVISHQESYIRFVAQETRSIRKLFILNFFSQKTSKSTMVK